MNFTMGEAKEVYYAKASIVVPLQRLHIENSIEDPYRDFASNTLLKTLAQDPHWRTNQDLVLRNPRLQK